MNTSRTTRIRALGRCIIAEDADRISGWKHLVLVHVEGNELIEPWLIESETIDVEVGDSEGDIVLMIRDGLLVDDLLASALNVEVLASRFGCPSSEIWIGVD